MKTLTNILNYEINRDAINNDFYIVRFENEIDFKKVNSRLLDNPDINILSLSYSYGKNAYALMYKEDYDDLRYCTDLENIKYSILSTYEAYDDIVIRLFLNVLSNYESEGLAYSNLTGKFYKFLDNCGRKIKALDFTIDKLSRESNLLLLRVSSTSFKKTKKFSYGEPTYVLTGNNRTLKRTFDSSEKDMYIKGNDKDKNTSHPFLVIKDGSGRAKEITNLVDLYNRKFSKYVSIKLSEMEINKKISPKKIKLQDETMNLIRDYKINVCSMITDSVYNDSINEFLSNFKAIGLKATRSQKTSKDKLNIVLIYDKDYYIEHSISDPHNSLDNECVNQCIIIDNLKDMFRFDESILPSAQLITVFKELLIKHDIVKNKNVFSYDDWTSYKFENSFTFIQKDENENLFKMVIQPDGKYTIYKEAIDLFNVFENEKYKNIFVSNKNVKLVIMDDKGNINAIERTEIITLPYSQLFKKLPISKSKNKKEELYSGLCDINYYETNAESYYNVGQLLPNIQMQIQRASHLYKIICIDNSKCFMTNILELMSVGFVKYNELTVLPYPIKYLREYIAMNNK